jgi:hypothetical protein
MSVGIAMDTARGHARAQLARVDDLLRDHVARGEVAGAVGLIARGLMRGPNDTALTDEFLTLAYQAIED